MGNVTQRAPRVPQVARYEHYRVTWCPQDGIRCVNVSGTRWEAQELLLSAAHIAFAIVHIDPTSSTRSLQPLPVRR